MSLLQKLEQDLMTAMKAKDTDKTSTLRMVKAAIINFQIEKKKNTIEDTEALEIFQRVAKQRRESIDSFEKAGRQELADKEKRELAILQDYLPKPLTDDEIRTLAKEAVAKSGAKSKADTGLVMKALMPLVKGKADGKRVTEIVASLLS